VGTGACLVWYETLVWVAMSVAEREEFLVGGHVGVLSAAMGTGGQTLAVPVWYSYQPGGLLTVLTGRRSRKAVAIRATGRFGLCAQDTHPAYRYVSVEGPVAHEDEPDPAERSAMARRYLGAAGGDQYVTANPDLSGGTWRSGCAQSTGSAKIRASDKPKSSAIRLASSDVPQCQLCAAATVVLQPRFVI
jgi:Pyridoxamine 5'-phosphate oxidase